MYQERWKSKAAVRAYHGDFIPEKVFKRWYLPQTIPDVRPRRAVFAGDDKLDLEEFAKRKLQAREKEKELEDEIARKGMAPVGSLMFTEVERRLDVFVFRCCFAHSVYEARRLIIHGYVKLNGTTVCSYRVVWVNRLMMDLFCSIPEPTRAWRRETWSR